MVVFIILILSDDRQRRVPLACWIKLLQVRGYECGCEFECGIYIKDVCVCDVNTCVDVDELYNYG
jgi:hypothetical protein